MSREDFQSRVQAFHELEAEQIANFSGPKSSLWSKIKWASFVGAMAVFIGAGGYAFVQIILERPSLIEAQELAAAQEAADEEEIAEKTYGFNAQEGTTSGAKSVKPPVKEPVEVVEIEEEPQGFIEKAKLMLSGSNSDAGSSE